MIAGSLQSAVERLASDTTGEPTIHITSAHPASGGCINEACALTFSDGGTAFLKFNRTAPPDLFACETDGLAQLATAGAIRVPSVLGHSRGDTEHPPFLLLEHIEQGAPQSRSDEELGRGLAAIHSTTAPQFGHAIDNYLGPTKQPNTEAQNWADFYLEHRLEAMLRLLEGDGRYANQLPVVRAVLPKIRAILQSHVTQPSLVHGDLWNGNVLYDSGGLPVLIDPAVYFSDREVDLAMAALFGGFSGRFFASYQEAWPLPDGHDERQPIYQLYHLLHHALLFGSGYMNQCLQVVRRYQ